MERKLRFELTCNESPEQYDVYDEEGYKVGYVRLRYGELSISCPCCGVLGAHNIMSWSTRGYGCFYDDDERAMGMNIINAAINHWLDYQYSLQLNVPYVLKRTGGVLPKIIVPIRIMKNDINIESLIYTDKNVKMVEIRSGFDDKKKYVVPLHSLTTYVNQIEWNTMSFDKARKNMKWKYELRHLTEENICPMSFDYHSERDMELISHVPYVITVENYVKWYNLYVTTGLDSKDVTVNILDKEVTDTKSCKAIELSKLFPESLNDISYLDHSWLPKSVVEFAIKHNMQIGRMAFNAIISRFYEQAKVTPKSQDDIDYNFLNTILPTKEDYEKVIVEDYGTVDRVDDMDVWANICIPAYIGDNPNPLLPVPLA